MTATHGIQLLKSETSAWYRPLSYFQANGTSVLQEGQVVILNEDPNFWKVGDGSTTLKNLRWYKSDASPLAPNPGLSNQGHSYWNYNSVLNRDVVVLGEMGEFTASAPNYSAIGASGALVARMYDINEPLILDYIGINSPIFTLAPGAVVTVTIGVYSLDLNIPQANLITSFSINPVAPGFLTNPVPLNQFIPSGKYMLSFHFNNTIPAGSETRFHSAFNRGYHTYAVPPAVSGNMYSMTTRIVTVIPAPPILPLPNMASNVTGTPNIIPIFNLFGTRIIKNL